MCIFAPRSILKLAAGGLLLGLGLRGLAFAHAAERGLVMLLPTQYYLVGGVLTVAASFGVVGLAPARFIRRVFAWRSRALVMPAAWRAGLSWVAFFIFALLIYVGFTGSRDPLANLLPLTIWSVWWVGFTLLHGVLGNLWAVMNPWSAPYRLIARRLGIDATRGFVQLPMPWGYGPAIIGFAAFAWFELISLAPDDPDILALAAVVYWVYALLGMLVFGQRDWCERAECFSVFFRLVSRLAVVQPGQPGLVGAAPGAGVLRQGALPVSGALFLLLGLASVSFDGLNKTFWWLGLHGINPLEFPGRSAVVGINAAGLAAAFIVLAGVYGLAIWGGWRLAGRRGKISEQFGGLALSLIPISLAFHAAHYLAVLLINGQYALVAASDPLSLQMDLLGYADYRVTGSWLTNHHTVALIWKAQAGMIVLGHMMAVVLAHALALQVYRRAREAMLSQAPLMVVMVGYTWFGLWLLATPVAG